MAETDFPRRIVTWREGRGLTQKEAAELIGIHHRTLQTYESGEHLPDPIIRGKLRTVGAPTQFDSNGASADYMVEGKAYRWANARIETLEEVGRELYEALRASAVEFPEKTAALARYEREVGE